MAAIVAPPPSVAQGHPISEVAAPGVEVDTSPGLEQLQKAFDRVFPEIKTTPTPKSQTPPPDTQPKPPEAPTAPVTQPQQPPEEPAKPPEEPAKPPADESHTLPSFLEDALKGETTTPAAQPAAEDEWPEELPTFKTPEESKTRYRKWRENYNGLKKELETLRSRPGSDPAQAQKLAYLENQNAAMAEQLTRFGVEQSVEFQQQVMVPLHAHWNEAARIVKDAGGDPQELAKAMSLNGRSQFEALDQIFSALPESAKAEAHDALRNYRRFDEARRRAIADAPRTMEGIRQREMERAMHESNRQREQYKGLFDNALKRLQEANVEVFVQSSDPKDKWWNEQRERMVEQARHLYMDNTDMGKVAMACLLAPTADCYRKLFIGSQKQVAKLQKIINDRIGAEPNLSESGGNQAIIQPERQLQEDLKKPFAQVFLREFHKSQHGG